MNLLNASEYTGKQGLYCGAHLGSLFAPNVEALCEQLGLEKPDADDLHCTLMYSRENAPAQLPKFTQPLNAAICSVQHWVGHNGKVYVVADLQSMSLCGAHTKLHKAGAKHSFAAFRPHITLGKIAEATPEFEELVEKVNWKLKDEPVHVVFTDIRANDINPEH